MKPLTITGANSFVAGFTSRPGVESFSVVEFLDQLPRRTRDIEEGSTEFDDFRCVLLRESERSLLMAENCYLRGLEGLREFSGYWSMVCLYYSAFFSIKAILGVHGCWMKKPNFWVEAVDSNPGALKLGIRKNQYSAGGSSGSHRVTWIAYYNAMTSLSSWFTSADAKSAIAPVNSNKTWMIDTRNDVNYDPSAAFGVMVQFSSQFDEDAVPDCFGGPLQTMLQRSRACLMFAKETALRAGVATNVVAPLPLRIDWVKQHVTGPQHPALKAFAATEAPSLEF